MVGLKAAIEQKSHIPVKEQSLYFQEQLMQDDRVLSSFPGLGDGGMVYLSRSPLTLIILSLLGDSHLELQLKIGHDIMVSKNTLGTDELCCNTLLNRIVL